jgi:hypothetical protein
MTEGVRNAVLTNIVVVSLALLLSCFTNDRETKILLGIPDTAVEQTPDTAPTGITLPADNMVSIPAPNNSMTA